MSSAAKNPFVRVDVAHEYVALLEETVAENKKRIDADVCEALNGGSKRHVEALRLAAYNLASLKNHLKASRRILNNLRKLQQLILKEPAGKAAAEQPGTARSIGAVKANDAMPAAKM